MRRQGESRPHSAVPATRTAPITPHSSRQRPSYRPDGIGAQFGLGAELGISGHVYGPEMKGVYARGLFDRRGILDDDRAAVEIC